MSARVISLGAVRLARATGSDLCACMQHVVTQRDTAALERDASGKLTGRVWSFECWARSVGVSA